MENVNETIAAISTSLGSGAISIIRLSGNEAIKIVNSCFKGKDLLKAKSHTIHYGHIVDEDVIDEVLVAIYRAPKTYTKEDIVEINCHGGAYVANKVLELVLTKGAKLAQAGEFTKRAFINGRIDLTQAEAVMDVINAKTKSSLKVANYGLSGQIKKMIESLRSDLLSCISKIEVNIDYPEYMDEEQMTSQIVKPMISKIIDKLSLIIKQGENALIIKNGIKTAIIGKPNVGKSSLLNALIGEEKAIVTNVAGTTRDIVEGTINLDGIVLNLIDTAGIHNTTDIVEEIGINRSINSVKEAELVIIVFDNSIQFSEEDKEVLELTKDKKRIIVVNKSDLQSKLDLSLLDEYLMISSFNSKDIERLTKKIKEVCLIEEINDIDASLIGNARQLSLLKQAKQQLNEAQCNLDLGYEVDIINIDIRNALESLCLITGDVARDDLINELFKNFCLGK